MKWFFIGLLFSDFAFSRTPELLKCLGREEKKFHLSKDTGPDYDLNQRLISEIVQIPNATIDPDVLLSICGASGGESWKLLQLSLARGKNLFIIPKTITGMQRKVTEGMIEDYFQGTREILLGLIAQIQALAPTPDCLTTEFPRLVPFFVEMKYLQEEVDIEKIFKGRDEKIFKDLRSYRGAFKRCQERLKKKLKSGSTKAPKKS